MCWAGPFQGTHCLPQTLHLLLVSLLWAGAAEAGAGSVEAPALFGGGEAEAAAAAEGHGAGHCQSDPEAAGGQPEVGFQGSCSDFLVMLF